jgi:hypothetical protein
MTRMVCALPMCCLPDDATLTNWGFQEDKLLGTATAPARIAPPLSPCLWPRLGQSQACYNERRPSKSLVRPV